MFKLWPQAGEALRRAKPLPISCKAVECPDSPIGNFCLNELALENVPANHAGVDLPPSFEEPFFFLREGAATTFRKARKIPVSEHFKLRSEVLSPKFIAIGAQCLLEWKSEKKAKRAA